MAGLTAKSAENLKPKSVRFERPDSVPGLYLVVQPSGAKSWVVRFRSPIEFDASGQRKPKKLTLGPFSADAATGEPILGHPLSLTQARALAAASLDQVKRGVDPTHARREQKAAAKIEATIDNTVDSAMLEFLRRYRGKKRQGLRESTRLLTAHYLGLKPDPEKPGQWIKRTNGGVLKQWSGRPLASITKRDAITLLDKLVDAGNGVTANRTLTNLKTFFDWTVKRDLLAASPVAVIDPPAEEVSRERTLTDSELTALWRAADAEGYPFGKLMQAIVLTGARRDEMREAPRSEFQIEGATVALPTGGTWQGPLWTLQAVRSKNGREHLVPLSTMAVDLLESLPRIGKSSLLFTTTGENPISGLSKAKQRLDAAMAIELRKIDPNTQFRQWTPHDLRRTFSTGLQRLGFQIEVIEECLNHKSGTRSGVAGVYARHRYLAEKAQAFEAWARHIAALVNGRTKDNVVALKTRTK